MQLIVEDERDISDRFNDLAADISDEADLLRQWISTTPAGTWIDIVTSLSTVSNCLDAYDDLLDQRKKYECIERSTTVNWQEWSRLYFSWNTFPDSDAYFMITFYMPRHYVSSIIYLREYLFPTSQV